MKLFTKDN